MNFYEDFLKNQKKNSQVNNGLADTWQKLKPALPKNAPKAQMQKTEKQTITSSAPKISNAINIFPKGQSFVAPRKPKTLIGNPNEKNEPVKLPYKPDTLNGKPKISKLPYRPYKPDSLNGNSGFGKLPDFNREEPKIDKGFTKFPYYTRQGSRIKGNLQSILNNKLGELDARHVFDGIDDDTIERNRPIAQAAIEDNIRKGLLTQEQLRKYPNMLDAMTMFYAAGEKGKPKAQNLARSVAYSEEKYPDIIPTGINLLSNDITATDIATLYNRSGFQPVSNPAYITENVYDILEKSENSTYYPNDTERKLLEAALKNRSTPVMVASRIKAVLEREPAQITEADPDLLAKSKPIEKEPMAHEKSIEEKNAEGEIFLNVASFLPGVGDVADIGLAALDALDGDWGSAALGLAGLIPGADAFTDTTRIARKADNVVDAAKVVDKANDAKKIIKSTISPHDLTQTHKLTLSKKQYSELADNIRKNGITEPIKYVEYNGTKYVVDGHHRLQIAKDLKLSEIPIEEVSLPYKGYNSIEDLLWME